MTHTDPKAEYSAVAIALAAQMAGTGERIDPVVYRSRLGQTLIDPAAAELLALVDRVVESLARHESALEFAVSLGLDRGVSGYVYHTVPMVLHGWLRNQRDYRSAVMAMIECGGDTDTTAAIVGGIVGGAVGKSGIPEEWLRNLWEWPRSATWLERLGEQLIETRSTGVSSRPLRLPATGLVARNLLFLAVVLSHGVRRLLPPY